MKTLPLRCRPTDTRPIRAIASDSADADDNPGNNPEKPRRDPCRTYQFIEEIARQLPRSWADLSNTLDETAKNGPPQNDTKFAPLRDGLFEFKAWKVRIACFFDGPLIICTHGFYKKQNMTPKDEVEYALRKRSAYLEAKKRGEIDHAQPRQHR